MNDLLGKSLVLVLGAGSSCEVGMPAGDALKTEIAALLDIRYANGRDRNAGDPAIDGVLRSMESASRDVKLGQLQEECWKIRDAMSLSGSIDNYLDSHRSNARLVGLGKLAIAKAILNAERHSKLHFERRNARDSLDFAVLEPTWFTAFFKILTEACAIEDLPRRLQSVAVVSFNYDRCFEHYMVHALAKFYDIPIEESWHLLDNIEVFHPYGVVGRLPRTVVHGMPNEGDTVFGAEVGSVALQRLASGLSTFTEGTRQTLIDRDRMKSTVRWAKRVLFLGFAFHRINMDLLLSGASHLGGDMNGVPTLPDVYASSYGLSTANCGVIAQRLKEGFGTMREKIMMHDKKCAEVVLHYWHSLLMEPCRVPGIR